MDDNWFPYAEPHGIMNYDDYFFNFYLKVSRQHDLKTSTSPPSHLHPCTRAYIPSLPYIYWVYWAGCPISSPLHLPDILIPIPLILLLYHLYHDKICTRPQVLQTLKKIKIRRPLGALTRSHTETIPRTRAYAVHLIRVLITPHQNNHPAKKCIGRIPKIG